MAQEAAKSMSHPLLRPGGSEYLSEFVQSGGSELNLTSCGHSVCMLSGERDITMRSANIHRVLSMSHRLETIS